jgi:hypothetical protein
VGLVKWIFYGPMSYPFLVFKKWKDHFVAFSLPIFVFKITNPKSINGLYWTFTFELKIVKHEY